MAEIQNFAPNFSIPPDAFKKDQDAYAQILPMLLAGQQQAQQRRQQQMVQQLLGQFAQPQTPAPPMQGPQMPGVGTTPGMIPPTSGMGVPAPQQPQQAPDPMKMILGLMQADPGLVQGAFPAFVRAAMQKQKSTEISPYQQQTLAIKKQQLADTEKYQSSREQLSQLEVSLRAKGLIQQAQRIHAIIADMDAKHPLLYGSGLLQSPGEAAGLESSGGDSDDGWSVEPAP